MKEMGLETGLARLQQRIDALLAQAQDNEAIQQRVHRLELALIASHGLAEYLHQLLVVMPKEFSLDAIRLQIHDSEHIIRRLVEENETAGDLRHFLLLVDNDSRHDSVAAENPLPLLEPYDGRRHHTLFGEQQARVGSVATLPLHRGERLLGVLSLASCDTERFTPERATDFLQHLAAIAAVCLENAINHEKLRYLGLTDGLTGVRNRRYFDQRLLDECRAVQRHGRPLACLFLDLDRFKQINDSHGHQSGDIVLQRTAERIARQLRDSDLLCRYGGEEFVVLLLDTDTGAASDVAERIRVAVSESEVDLPEGILLPVTLSVGVAVVENTDELEAEQLASQLVEAADAALYRAKASGRNCVELAEQRC